jgi:beta-glucanase (GH16 family)
MVACGLPWGAPAASAAEVWKPAWSTDFSGSKLPSQCGTYSSTYAGNAWSADEVTVSGGLLRIGLEKRTSQGKPYTSGGVGCWNAAQSYGRYEWRAKVPPGKGIDSYVVLWATTDAEGDWTGIEILAPGPETAHLTNGYGSGTDGKVATGHYSDTFHNYLVEWAPGLTRISQDGRELYRSSKSYPGKRWIGFVVSNGDNLTGLPDGNTPLPAQFQIDSLKVSSYAGQGAAAGPATTTTARRATPTTTKPRPSPSISAAAATASPTATLPSTTDDTEPAGFDTTVAGEQIPTDRVDTTSNDTGGLGWLPVLLVSVLGAVLVVGLMRAARRGPWSPRRGRHSD